MKLKMFLSYLSILAMLGVLGAVGLYRGFEISRTVSSAYVNYSLDEYLGKKVDVSSTDCASIAEDVKSRMLGSSAPKRLQGELAAFKKTFDSGSVSTKTFAYFKGSDLIGALTLNPDLDSITSIERKVSTALRLDLKSIKTLAVAGKSNTVLAAEIKKLDDANQLPAAVSTESWKEASKRKFESACSRELDGAIQGPAKAYEGNIAKYGKLALQVLNSDWMSSGFKKVSPLVAYAPWPGGSCAGAGYLEDCATFKIQTATACTVTVDIEFSDSNNDTTGDARKTVKVSAAKRSTNVVAISNNSYGASYYEITGAKCK